MPKRSNGEGTVWKNEKRGCWCAEVTVGYTPDGKPKRRRFQAATKREVLAKMREVQGDISDGTYVNPAQITLADQLTTWLNVHAKPQVRPKTYKLYAYAVNTMVIPEIGKMKLADLTSTKIQKLINTLAGKYSASTVDKARQVIRMACKQAKLDGLIKINPTENVKVPKASKRIIPAVPPDDIAAALVHWRQTRYGIALPLLLYTGLRIGELLALTWDDIDWDAKTINVTKTQYDLKIDDGPFTFHIGEPKTPAGYREVPVSEELIALLKNHRLKQRENQLKAGSLWQEHNRVMAKPDGRPVWYMDLTYALKYICKVSGIPRFSPHQLRHTFATNLVVAGVHPRVAQALLGHDDISMTMRIYSEAPMEAKKQAIEAVKVVL